MGPPKSFEDLEVWRAAEGLAIEVCRLSRDGALAKDYGFRDQFQAAGLALMGTIADGHEQGDRTEFMRSLRTAKGLAARVRSMAHVAKDLGYVSEPQHAALLERLTSIFRQLGGFIRYLEKGPAPAAPKSDFVNEPAPPRRVAAR